MQGIAPIRVRWYNQVVGTLRIRANSRTSINLPGTSSGWGTGWISGSGIGTTPNDADEEVTAQDRNAGEAVAVEL